MADFFNRLSYVNSSTIKMFLNYDSGATGINTEYYDINGNQAREPWRNSPISRYDSIFTSTGYNITGLYNHSTNPIRIKGYFSGPNGNFGVQHIWITGTNVSYLYHSNVTKTSMRVYWYDPAEYGRFAIEVFGPSGNQIDSNYYLTPGLYGEVSYTITGLQPGTQYQIKVYAVGYVKNGTPIYKYITTSAPTPPSSVSSVSLSVSSSSPQISVSWNNVSNETGYAVELYSGYNNTNTSNHLRTVYVGANVTSTTFTSTHGVGVYSWYTVKVYAYNGDGNGGSSTNTIMTQDTVSPTVSIIASDGDGRIYVRYSASDTHSGLRTGNTYALHIGTANGSDTSTKHQFYTTNTQISFDSDANGNAFVNGAYYWVKVYAYDKNNNISPASAVRIQYKLAHPGTWSWHVSKTKGSDVTVTAVEWDSLCKKINQFRTYKGYSIINFTTVSKGTNITASIVNEARNAIAGMSPPTSAPPAVSRGDDITAYFFNRLVQSMNSIT